MIDYKLVLILVLSIVLLYLYNRVDYLKDDLKNQQNIQNNQKELIETINKNLDIITKRNIELEKKFRLSNNLVNNNLNSNEKNNDDCLGGICKIPPKNDQKIISPPKNESINKLNITLLNNNEKNTTEYSATENDSDSESLNLTSSDNIILYSNDKSDKSSVNKSDIESIDTNNIIDLENIEITHDLQKDNTVLLEEPNTIDIENIEITHDLQKDNTILLEANTIDDIINVESLIDKLNDQPILFNKTFLNTNLDKKPSSYLEVIDPSNSNDDLEDNDLEDNDLNNCENIENTIITDNKKSYSDLDYDNSEKSKISNNSEDKTSEKNIDSLTLDEFNKYKLNELQNIAKDKNIELTTFKNGKVKNKTKKELYSEISNL